MKKVGQKRIRHKCHSDIKERNLLVVSGLWVHFTEVTFLQEQELVTCFDQNVQHQDEEVCVHQGCHWEHPPKRQFSSTCRRICFSRSGQARARNNRIAQCWSIHGWVHCSSWISIQTYLHGVRSNSGNQTIDGDNFCNSLHWCLVLVLPSLMNQY